MVFHPCLHSLAGNLCAAKTVYLFPGALHWPQGRVPLIWPVSPGRVCSGRRQVAGCLWLHHPAGVLGGRRSSEQTGMGCLLTAGSPGCQQAPFSCFQGACSVREGRAAGPLVHTDALQASLHVLSKMGVPVSPCRLGHTKSIPEARDEGRQLPRQHQDTRCTTQS